jgi:hypothetical protein
MVVAALAAIMVFPQKSFPSDACGMSWTSTGFGGSVVVHCLDVPMPSEPMRDLVNGLKRLLFIRGKAIVALKGLSSKKSKPEIYKDWILSIHRKLDDACFEFAMDCADASVVAGNDFASLRSIVIGSDKAIALRKNPQFVSLAYANEIIAMHRKILEVCAASGYPCKERSRHAFRSLF